MFGQYANIGQADLELQLRQRSFNHLATGESLTLTYTIEVQDSQGAVDTQTVVITVTGTADAPVITGGPDTTLLTETNAGLSDTGTFTVTILI
jgi:VCBS repeat-containing protein